MSTRCCHTQKPLLHSNNGGYRRILWTVLAINAGMFVLETLFGLTAKSASLQADALDFLGDAANYGISLGVAGLALHHRARAALIKGFSMAGFGVWILAISVWHTVGATVPEASTMGTVGFGALLANVLSFGLLWAHRSGDSNMRSVWLCSRNDVIGNFAVLLAAAGVFGTRAGWPDVVVALIMACLAIQGAWIVVRTASKELTGVQS